MADVSMSAQVTRIDSMETVDNTDTLGGGSPEIQETDFVYQGLYSVSRKVSATSNLGFYTAGAAGPYNISGTGTYQVLMLKVLATNNLSLSDAPNGLRNRIGSGESDYHEYDQYDGNDYPFLGGWLVIPVDATIAGYRSRTVGTPGLTAADLFGIFAGFDNTSKSENLVLDAVDVGNGLTLVGGDGASADGSFQDFIDYDQGTQTNKWGFVHTSDGVVIVYGTLVIGSATATEFTAVDETLVFPDGKFPAGWSSITIDLANASTVVDLDRVVMIGKGNETVTDTRPDFVVTGTNGSLDIDYCFFINFRTISLSAGVTFNGNNIVGGSENFIQNGASIENTTFDKPVKAAGEAFLVSDDPESIKDCYFESGGNGHAIELDTAGTYTFDGNTFVSYGANDTNDASIYNNSGGHITLNVIGASSGITVRNGAGATTTVNQVVQLKIHVEDEAGDPISGASVAIFTNETTPVELMREATTAGGLAEESYSYSTDKDVIIRVRKSSSGGSRYFPVERAEVINSLGLETVVELKADTIASA